METLTTTKVQSAHSHDADYPTQKATTTRTATMHPPEPDQPQLSAPASQESFLSVQSTGSSVAPLRLQASDSNLSQLTSYTDTDNISPISSAGDKNANDVAHTSDKPQTQRNRTPENGIHLQQNVGSALASPMSIASPVATNGAKRTACGHVKNAPSLPEAPYGPNCPNRESRRDSMSSSGSRAGELAASLKTRLGYAMAKVQHGWEHKSLQEVEQLAAYKARTNRYSMSHVDQQRPGTSGLGNGTARFSMYDQHYSGPLELNGLPPSKRHSGTYTGYMYPAPQRPSSYALTPCLQPAADIRPTSSSRPYPSTTMSYQHAHTSAMSPPQTPVNAAPRRPPMIRTETQTKDAEMEALQALIGLGSPRTSQLPTSSQGSPDKMDQDTPRKFTFARSGSNSSANSSIPGPSQMSSQTEHIDVR